MLQYTSSMAPRAGAGPVDGRCHVHAVQHSAEQFASCNPSCCEREHVFRAEVSQVCSQATCAVLVAVLHGLAATALLTALRAPAVSHTLDRAGTAASHLRSCTPARMVTQRLQQHRPGQIACVGRCKRWPSQCCCSVCGDNDGSHGLVVGCQGVACSGWLVSRRSRTAWQCFRAVRSC
jgi:hypothetical protein